jgi:hypothetical protein
MLTLNEVARKMAAWLRSKSSALLSLPQMPRDQSFATIQAFRRRKRYKLDWQ